MFESDIQTFICDEHVHISFTHLFKYLQAVCVIVVSKVNHPLLAVLPWGSLPVLSEPPQSLVSLLHAAGLQPAGVTLRWETGSLLESWMDADILIKKTHLLQFAVLGGGHI